MIAKASTTCTYSLDPITLSPGIDAKPIWLQEYISRLCHPSPQEEPGKGWLIQSLPCVGPTPNQTRTHAHPAPRETATLYFSRLLKNSRCTNRNWPHPPVKNQSQISPLQDLLGYALYPDPPQLQILVEVNGIEPMTSCLQSTRSPN